MNRFFQFGLFFCLSLQIMAQNNKMEIKYPETRKDNTIDTYFGEKVADPYRGLEDDLSAET